MSRTSAQTMQGRKTCFLQKAGLLEMCQESSLSLASRGEAEASREAHVASEAAEARRSKGTRTLSWVRWAKASKRPRLPLVASAGDV